MTDNHNSALAEKNLTAIELEHHTHLVPALISNSPIINKKGQLSLTNPHDTYEKFALFT